LGQGVKNEQHNLIKGNVFGENLLRHEKQLIHEKNTKEKKKRNKKSEKRIPD
jgi:hypothetical protein